LYTISIFLGSNQDFNLESQPFGALKQELNKIATQDIEIPCSQCLGFVCLVALSMFVAVFVYLSFAGTTVQNFIENFDNLFSLYFTFKPKSPLIKKNIILHM
jgi:hypothetical protein